jgi:hypothetical protein
MTAWATADGSAPWIVVSEPLGELAGAWHPVPEASYGVAQKGADELSAFRPSLP